MSFFSFKKTIPRPRLLLREAARSKKPGAFYEGCHVLWRVIFGCTMRIKAMGLEHLPEVGGYIIAVSHVSHLDPIVVSSLLARRINWVSRIEFYQQVFMRAILRAGGAFPVDRDGAARPTLREGLRRLASGEIVGIFPEGELMSGQKSVLRGAKIKQGACWLAARSGNPLVPVVVLGTDRLATISPWLPAKRGRLWVAVGKPISAVGYTSGREGRNQFEAVMSAEYLRLFRELRETYDLPESIVP